MKYKILVTGGAGFIGSHITDTLLKQGHKVKVIDNFDPYYDPKIKRNNIKHSLTNENFELIEGDIRNKELVRRIINENSVDYVFHEAAQGGVRFSVENRIKTHDVNVTGTLNVLNACIDSGVKSAARGGNQRHTGGLYCTGYHCQEIQGSMLNMLKNICLGIIIQV